MNMKYAPLVCASFSGLVACTNYGYELPGLDPYESYEYRPHDSDGGYFDEEEWVLSSFKTVDYNDDELIDENEWGDYDTVWYSPYDYAYYYDFFDSIYSYDGEIDGEEFTDAFGSDLYDFWDRDEDGYINVEEYEVALNTYESGTRLPD